MSATQSNYDDWDHGGWHWVRWVFVGLIVFVVLAFLGSMFWGGHYGYGPMMNYGGPYYGWFFFPFGFIFPLIFIFFIFRFVFWGFGGWGWRRRYRYGGYGYGDAREILRQRYARGEITKEQFDQMMRDVQQ